MKIVLLSGGSGRRLWPLSNDSRSKQFLKILKDENGTYESMVQRIWRQLRDRDMAQDAFIAAGSGQTELLQSQLGADIRLIVEPERRDTFPAIALASAYLSSIAGADPNETIIVMPVDPYVELSFLDRLKDMGTVLDRTSADLALIGVEPTYPSEQYGYIIPDPGRSPLELSSDLSAFRVQSFREKPNREDATRLVAQNGLWNCGVFAFKLGMLLEYMIGQGFPVHYGELAERYDMLPKISFDYEIVEKMSRIVAIPFVGMWKDLGNWETLTEEVPQPVVGNGILSNDCENTHLINELDLPIVVLGCSNVIVAASKEGILVADKARSVEVKDVVNRREARVSGEDEGWGSREILNVEEGDDHKITVARLAVKANRYPAYHYHAFRDESWTILSGAGEAVLDGTVIAIKPGDILLIPAGARHTVRALTNMEIIEVQKTTRLIEEDLYLVPQREEENKGTVLSQTR